MLKIKNPLKAEETQNSGPENQASRAQNPEAIEASVQKLKKISREESAIRKVVRRSASIANLITDDDVEESMKVIREAKRATNRFYDHEAKAVVEHPDHKTRLAAATLERAYDEGMPTKKVIVAVAEFKDAQAVIADLKASPMALDAIRTLSQAGLSLQVGEEVIDVETQVIPEQAEEEET